MPLFHVELIFSSFPAAGEPHKSQAGYEQENTVSHHSETAKITSILVPHPTHMESWKWHTGDFTNIPTAIQSPIQPSQKPPCSPPLFTVLQGSFWESWFETPRPQPWDPKHEGSFSCSLWEQHCRISPASPLFFLLLCYHITTEISFRSSRPPFLNPTGKVLI